METREQHLDHIEHGEQIPIRSDLLRNGRHPTRHRIRLRPGCPTHVSWADQRSHLHLQLRCQPDRVRHTPSGLQPGVELQHHDTTDTIGAATVTKNICYDAADRIVQVVGQIPRSTGVAQANTIEYDTLGTGSMTQYGTTRMSHTYSGQLSGVGSSAAAPWANSFLDANGRIRRRDGDSAATPNESLGYGHTEPGDAGLKIMVTTYLDQTPRYHQIQIPLPGGAVLTKEMPATPSYATVTGLTGGATGDKLSLPNIHGDLVAQVLLDGTTVSTIGRYGPYGEQPGAVPDTGKYNLDYGWLGSHMKQTERNPGATATTGTNPGVIMMGARGYLPGIGRFTSVDPIEGGTANDYAYPNDPINQFDLDGRCGWLGNPFKECDEARAKRGNDPFGWFNRNVQPGRAWSLFKAGVYAALIPFAAGAAVAACIVGGVFTLGLSCVLAIAGLAFALGQFWSELRRAQSQRNAPKWG
jgi:RHS repeat-associated protein